jgi:hypothetical protein
MKSPNELNNTPRRIRVFRSSERPEDVLKKHHDARVFVTIGAGETRVTILDDEGICDKSWTAIFGWSFLFSVPVDLGEKTVTLDEQETVALALSGHARIYGRLVNTASYLEAAEKQLKVALDDILSQTVGSGALFSAIVLAAPHWLHDLLSGSVMIRPHILHEIHETSGV